MAQLQRGCFTCIVLSLALCTLAHSLPLENFLGFTAYKRTEEDFQEGQIVILENEIVDEGDFYDTTTGIFTCPSNGVYYATLNLERDFGGTMNVDVVLEDVVVLSLTEQYSDNDETVSGVSGLVWCLAGQQIYLRASSYTRVFGDQFPRSTFSVMRIYDTGVGNDTSSFVGVTAYKRLSETYVGGETITLDGILFSSGSAFEDGVFTCPLDGVYYIAVHFQRNGEYDLHLDVMKGSDVILRSTDSSSDNREAVRSNTGLVSCLSGEEISIYAFHSGAIAGRTEPSSLFTAMLLDIPGTNSSLTGFTASKLTSEPQYELYVPLVFEEVVVESGGDFDVDSGTFTCPVLGLYFVSVNVQVFGDSNVYIDVVRNNVPFLRLYNYGFDNEDTVVSNAAVVRCFTGEQISLTPYNNGGVKGAAFPVTTWTAILMYEY